MTLVSSLMVAAVVTCTGVGKAPAPAVQHFVFGLTPSADFDVKRGSITVLHEVRSSAAGTLLFSAAGTGSFRVVPAVEVEP